MRKISRRRFLQASAVAFSAVTTLNIGSCVSAADKAVQTAKKPGSSKHWFKGNLHMHCQWSDGDAMPEYAVNWYKSHGYQFICPSDHNIFQSSDFRLDAFGTPNIVKDVSAFKGETSFWKPILEKNAWARLTPEKLKQSTDIFGKDSIRTKKVEGHTFVRMKTFDELEKEFCESGRFLMIPGYEQTGGAIDGRQVHMNFINVRKEFPYISAAEPLDIFKATFVKGKELYAADDYLFTANHPLWRYYDFSPNDMIAMPQIRLWELTNNDIASGLEANPQGWKPEKFWDVVNAYRAAHDQQLMLGMGSDDRHNYADSAANGWTVVRAPALNTSALLNAIRNAEFYASNGLDFDDIHFDGKTLSVKINVKEEGKYRILFIGTKKDYNPEAQTLNVKKGPKNPARRIEIYSDEIGKVFETVEGTEGSYTLKPDDLYVRAKIVKVTDKMQEDWKSSPAAWSQPYKN